jgi:integrase
MAGIVKKRETDCVGKEPFTTAELQRIFACLDDEFRLLCAIGLYTTLRLSDAARLRWEQLTPDLGYLDTRHSKTGADASMRTPGPLRELLARVHPQERQGPVLKRYGTMPRSSLCREVQGQLQGLGIQTQRELVGLNGQRRLACVRGFHSFRHTAITLALAKGKSSAQVRRWAGHATEAMQRRYAHLDADVAGDAADAVGKFW